MARPAIVLGSLTAALAVIAGAFAAHALETRLAAPQLELWETAARYLMYAGLGGLGAGLLGGKRAGRSGFVLVAGGWIFFVAVGGLALGGPSTLGAIAPLGGSAMIVGFLMLAWAGMKG